MMDTFDVLLVDLQDVGCRIYTFVTTLRYVLEEAARRQKSVWVLDRPNPVGRPVEGLRLREGWESFVGAAPLPMRHGLTLGELARWFEPTFQKHAGQLCAGLQIHVEDAAYAHDRFRPWRLVALVLKALRRLRPDYPIWRDFPYEYERGRLAIDVINGSELLRRWVDDPAATPEDLEALAAADEAAWQDECEAVRLYA